jgi:hypothetical protein
LPVPDPPDPASVPEPPDPDPDPLPVPSDPPEPPLPDPLELELDPLELPLLDDDVPFDCATGVVGAPTTRPDQAPTASAITRRAIHVAHVRRTPADATAVC